MQAWPVVPPNEHSKSVALLGEIESLCVTVNEMVGRLEDSFHVGAGLPPEAFLEPSTRLETVRAELAALFKNKRLSMGVAQNHDLLIVHLMLPELSGTELISRLRRHNTTVPIIVLTARDAVDEPWRKPAFSPE